MLIDPSSDGPFLVQRGNPIAGVRNANPTYKGRRQSRLLSALDETDFSFFLSFAAETIESVFYMWRITRDKKWQDKVSPLNLNEPRFINAHTRML